LIGSTAVAVVGAALAIAVNTRFIGIALVGVATAIYAGIGRVREKGQSEIPSQRETISRLSRQLPWAIALAPVLVVVAVVRGIVYLGDEPGRSVVFFVVAGAVVVMLLRFARGLRRLSNDSDTVGGHVPEEESEKRPER
jgi:hypothetical protein